MGSRNSLRAVLTLFTALVLGVLAENPRLGKNDYFDPNDWSLVPADSEPITSLSDLKSGVYSIRLSGERSGCGLDSKGPGMLMMMTLSMELCL
jgi:hypothetical protein